MKFVSRRKFVKSASAGLVASVTPPYTSHFFIRKTPESLSLAEVRTEVSGHLEKIRDKGGPYGSYRIGIGQRPDLYSSCDVSIIRTLWGEDLEKDLSESQRTEWIDHINSFANKSDGSYFDRYGHSKFHANGMTIKALGPLAGQQAYPVKLYHEFNTKKKIIPWLERLNWSRLWPASHAFTGGINCYANSTLCGTDWLELVFDWLDQELDAETGFWRKKVIYDDRFQGLGGSVHIFPLYDHHQRIFPYPRRVIDRVLEMQLPNNRWLDRPGSSFMHYLEMDALYALKYMQSLEPGYRKIDIEKAVKGYGQEVIRYWSQNSEDILSRHPHRILSAVGTFGLLQYHLPEMFYDEVTWTDQFSDSRFGRTDLVEKLAK